MVKKVVQLLALLTAIVGIVVGQHVFAPLPTNGALRRSMSASVGQNLLPLMQNPPVQEFPVAVSPTDIRTTIKVSAIAAIKFGSHPSTAVELKNNQYPYELYAGFRSIEAQEPVTNRTIFRIASMSKMVTALTSLIYVEKGQLSLDEEISSYIHSFEDATVIKKVATTPYPFTSVTSVAGSPLVTIPLPYLSSANIAELYKLQAGVQVSAGISGINFDGIFTVMSFNIADRTVTLSLNCEPAVSGSFNVNGTIDLLPKLPSRWSPYDYVYVSSNPDPNFFFVKSRVYYSTEPSKPVTVRHLLSHTAGVGYYTTSYSANLASLQTAIMMKRDPVLSRWMLTPTLDMDVVEWAERMGRIPMRYQPGTEYNYGPQLAVLGGVLVAYERARSCGDSTTSLYDIQKRVLFDPLNITDAGYFIKNDDPRRAYKIANLAHVYTNLDTAVYNSGTAWVSDPYVSLAIKFQDSLLPGLQAGLMDGTNPSGEGDANPLHPIYGTAAPKKMEAGDAGLYMRNDEYQRIVTMLAQKGVYNGQRIVQESTLNQMFTNQIGNLNITDQDFVVEPTVKWGFGVAVGDGSISTSAKDLFTAHWAGAYGGWWMVNQPSITAFTLSSNMMPGIGYRNLVTLVANITKDT